ncbi:MAG: hypothetical protein M3238_00935 [Actinomycetota bacterium]|nr:hypothetical protein [Actinomycetota bacterium]
MTELYRRRRFPFAVVAAVVAVVSIAVARLPDSLVVSIENNRPFTSAQAGWAYRLLAFAAVGQAVYGAFVFLRVERVKRAQANDPKVAAMPHVAVIGSLSRNAAVMVLWSLVYGLAAFGVTGERGGFWLYPLLCVFQAAWYFREIGAVARWLAFQPAAIPEEAPPAFWQREPPDYCPPVARGLVDRGDPEPQSPGERQPA